MSVIARPVFSAAILVVVFTAVSAIAVAAQETDLVKVDAVVTETRDRKVVGLQKENFQLWEDSVAQEIISMTPGRTAGEYVLTFKSSNNAKDGQWRKLRVQVVPPKGLDGTSVTFSVLATSGYYAPASAN